MIDFHNAEFLKLAPADAARAQSSIRDLLIPGESVEYAFKTVRDSVIFTSRRIIAANVQGITGRKVDYTSLLYSKIQSFSVESAGTLDLDCELTLWFSGLGRVKFDFIRGVDVLELSRFIAQAVL